MRAETTTRTPVSAPTLQLLWFVTTVDRAVEMAAAGVDAVVVDWEQRGKHDRQVDRNTQINQHSLTDLRQVRAAVDCPIVCRINAVGDHTPDELEAAIAAGANDILVPMVRRRDEIEMVLDQVAKRARVATMIETADAVEAAPDLLDTPIAWAYIGLHDLWIDTGSRHPFVAIADGTVDRVLRVANAADVPAGFGGLTQPGKGRPLAVEHLVCELARTAASLTFLRRSFEQDAGAGGAREELDAIRSAVGAAQLRPPPRVEADRRAAWDACTNLPDPPWVL